MFEIHLSDVGIEFVHRRYIKACDVVAYDSFDIAEYIVNALSYRAVFVPAAYVWPIVEKPPALCLHVVRYDTMYLGTLTQQAISFTIEY